MVMSMAVILGAARYRRFSIPDRSGHLFRWARPRRPGRTRLSEVMRTNGARPWWLRSVRLFFTSARTRPDSGETASGLQTEEGKREERCGPSTFSVCHVPDEP